MVICSRCGRYSGTSYMCWECRYTTSLDARGSPQRLALNTSEDRQYAHRFQQTYGRMPSSNYELSSYRRDERNSMDRDWS
jgi:hypothetical protein